MENLVLKAENRSAAKNEAKVLRRGGKIPAVLYGHGLQNSFLAVDYNLFEKIYAAGGRSGLLALAIDGKPPVKVLLQDFQLHPLSNRFTHIDFRQVRMDEKIKTNIRLRFIGEAPAVKELGGIFVKSFSEVPAECLPEDLLPEIAVDISSLKEFGNVIHVQDIASPKGVKILAHAEDVIATVTPPRAEEEVKPAEAAVDLTQIKTEAEEKREKKAIETVAEEEVKPGALKEEKK